MIQLVQLSHSVLSRCFSLSRSVTSTLYTFSCTAVLASSPVASGTHAGIYLRPSGIGWQYSRSIYTARLIVWQPRRAADTSTSLFCCCTASMEQATDGAETAVIDGLVSSWSGNISVSFCLRAPVCVLSLWRALGLLGAIQVPQLQLHSLPCYHHIVSVGLTSDSRTVVRFVELSTKSIPSHVCVCYR